LSAALVSFKMEKRGPFKGSRGDVEGYIREFYQDSARFARQGV